MERIIKVGKMPGRIQEVAVEENMTVHEVLEVADLDSAGYMIKGDADVLTLDSKINGYNTLLLVKQVKGA